MERVSRGLAGLLIAVGLSGCGNVGKSNEERITDAMPPSSAVLASKEKLDALMQSVAADATGFERDYAARLSARARECAGDYTASLFASAATVRDALTDKDCFARSDEAIVQWLDMRRIGQLLASPPLRPIPASPPAIIAGTGPIQRAVFASSAGVALLQVGKKQQLVDIGSGVVVHEAEDPQWRASSLSPNGRLVVAGDGRSGTRLHDALSGEVLAEFKLQPARFHWLDGIGAVFREEMRDDGNGRQPLVFLDFSTGNRQTIPMTLANLEKALPIPGKPQHYRLLAYNRMAEISLEKDATGWKASLLSEQPLREGPYRTDSATAVDGSYLVAVDRDLRQLMIASGQQRTFPLQPLRLQRVIETPDTDRLLLELGMPGSYSTDSYVYSLGNDTLARVEESQLLSRRFLFIPSLRRNGAIDGDKINVLDDIPTELAVDRAAMTQQLQEEQAARSAALAGEQQAQEEEIRRILAMSGQSRNDATLAAALTRLQAAQAGRGEPGQARRPPAASPVHTATGGPLFELARNASIESIGVYEAGNAPRVAGAGGRAGSVQVRVRRSSKPIILVLSAYEPVNWMLTVEPGANLVAVLTAGYHSGQVFGAGRARLQEVGRLYAYKRGGAEYNALNSEVQRMTGKPIDSFQGRYDGDTFVTGL